MPLVFIQSPVNGVHIALWEVVETPTFFLEKLDTDLFDLSELAVIPHPQKQLEWLASRYCLQQLTEGLQVGYQGISKDSFGKPHLSESSVQVSLSHTLRYVAVGIAPYPIGIDLEIPTEKLQRVAHKFLSETEATHAQNDIRRLCLYWSAKEALYKWYGRKQLSFKENLFIEPFNENPTTMKGFLRLNAQETPFDLWVMRQKEVLLVVALEALSHQRIQG